MKPILVNTRVLSEGMRGIPRYVQEILPFLEDEVELVSPAVGPWKSNVGGVIWEQSVLPLLAAKKLLWSPANFGPIVTGNQVVTIHDLIPIEAPTPGVHDSRLKSLYIREFMRGAARRSKAVIAVSKFTKTRITEVFGVDSDKVHVVYHGISPRFHPRSPEEFTPAVRRYGLQPDNYILVVGSNNVNKNTERLLQAWGASVSRLPSELRLALVGITLREPHKQVTVLGRVNDDDLPLLYAGAQALVHVAYYEGFGFTPLEAMASGVPVISGDKTSLPEVVGNTAVLVDPFDVEAIAEAIVRVAADSELRSSLREQGLARAKLFSWEKAARETLEVLRQAAQN